MPATAAIGHHRAQAAEGLARADRSLDKALATATELQRLVNRDTGSVSVAATPEETPAQVLADMIAETNQRLRLERRTAERYGHRARALRAARVQCNAGNTLHTELTRAATEQESLEVFARDRADALARDLGTLRAALAITEAVAATPAQKAQAEAAASQRPDNCPMAAEALIETLNEATRRGFQLDPKLVAP